MYNKYRNDALVLHTINHILIREWDPLNIAKKPSLHEEYEPYLPRLFSLVCDHASTSDIFEYLWWIEQNVMEHPGNKTRTLAAAQLLSKISIPPPSHENH